jgi:hypothetical protein
VQRDASREAARDPASSGDSASEARLRPDES